MPSPLTGLAAVVTNQSLMRIRNSGPGIALALVLCRVRTLVCVDAKLNFNNSKKDRIDTYRQAELIF